MKLKTYLMNNTTKKLKIFPDDKDNLMKWKRWGLGRHESHPFSCFNLLPCLTFMDALSSLWITIYCCETQKHNVHLSFLQFDNRTNYFPFHTRDSKRKEIRALMIRTRQQIGFPLQYTLFEVLSTVSGGVRLF
jgi:hypothetical protein